ncbi:MAG: hypothetical protein IJL12_03875 [Selenomonadaceae bacterium]|nr:hypothetical protein [Selenomonadaceae bacterium]
MTRLKFILPLAENHELSTEPALSISEETGTISVAEGGRLMRRFDEKTLAAKICPAFEQKENKIFGKFFSRWRAEQ